MIKRKTKSILVSVAAVLCGAVSAFSAVGLKGGISAVAATNGDNTLFTQEVTANYNVQPASYLGIEKAVGTKVRFAANETVTFAKEITVDTGRTDLIDFASHPSSAVVNGEVLYSYDLEEVKIRVDKLDSSGNAVADSYIEAVVFTSTENRNDVKIGGQGASDDWTGNGLSGIYAYGPGQTPTGYRNVDGEDRMSTLGAAIHFSFYKGGANGRAKNDRVLLQYDESTNSLHFANAEKYGENATKIIRDFDAEYYADANNRFTKTETNPFAGFQVGDKLRISVTTVGNKEEHDLFFYQTGGEAAIIPVYVPVDTALMTNSSSQLTVPQAKLYTASGLTVSSQALLGKTGAQFKVEAIGQGANGADLIVKDFTAYNASNAKVTMKNGTTPITGNCRFTYRYNGNQYSAIYEVMPETKANADYPLTIRNAKTDWTADNRYPANISEFAIPVSAVMESEMDRNGYDTVTKTFSVYKDGNSNGKYDGSDSLAQGYLAGASTKTTLSACDLSSGQNSFNVNAEGVYFVVYEAEDGLGRTTTLATNPIVVSYAGHRFVEGTTVDEVVNGKIRTVSYQMISGKKLDSLTFSKEDVIFYDYRVNSLTPSFTAKIEVTNPNGVKTTYGSGYQFIGVGEYQVEYTLNYVANGYSVSKTLTRILDVYDDVAPTITTNDDARLDGDKHSTDSLKYVRAVVGSKLLINNIQATDALGGISNLRSAISCQLIRPDGSRTNLTQTMKDAGYFLTINFDTVGAYSLIFEVEDTAGNGAMLRYEIDVRNEWLNVYVLAGMASETNSAEELYIPGFKIHGVAGNELTGKTGTSALYDCTDQNNVTKVKDNVAGTTVKDLAPGAYFVKYAVTEGEFTHEKSLYFTVIDTTMPTIERSGGETTGKVGAKIKLATFTAADNDIVRQTTLKVVKGDKEANVYDGAFVPEEEGEYTVIYTATDVAGNTMTSEYTVTVRGFAPNGGDVGGGSCSSSIANVGTVTLIAIMLLSVAVVRKARQKNEK